MSLLYRQGAFFAPLKITGQREKEIEALVDTGAFITGVSIQDCIEIKTEPSGTRLVKGIFGAALLPTFRCKIEVAGKVFSTDIVGLPEPGAILGRDLLRTFKTTLDWKAKTAHVEDPHA